MPFYKMNVYFGCDGLQAQLSDNFQLWSESLGKNHNKVDLVAQFKHGRTFRNEKALHDNFLLMVYVP